MDNVQIELDNPRRPKVRTEKMKNAGVFGSFDIIIKGDEGVLASLRENTLLQNKKGEFWVASPNRTYQDKDGQDQRAYYHRLFPDSDNRDSLMNTIVTKAKQLLGVNEDEKSTSPEEAEVSTSTGPIKFF